MARRVLISTTRCRLELRWRLFDRDSPYQFVELRYRDDRWDDDRDDWSTDLFFWRWDGQQRICRLFPAYIWWWRGDLNQPFLSVLGVRLTRLLSGGRREGRW